MLLYQSDILLAVRHLISLLPVAAQNTFLAAVFAGFLTGSRTCTGNKNAQRLPPVDFSTGSITLETERGTVCSHRRAYRRLSRAGEAFFRSRLQERLPSLFPESESDWDPERTLELDRDWERLAGLSLDWDLLLLRASLDRDRELDRDFLGELDPDRLLETERDVDLLKPAEPERERTCLLAALLPNPVPGRCLDPDRLRSRRFFRSCERLLLDPCRSQVWFRSRDTDLDLLRDFESMSC